MAVFTISANTNYSAIKASLANGDTIRIDTNAVRLTVDEAPLLTGITVDSPGVSGRMTVSGAYDMSTWSIVAGTVALIDGTFPAGAALGNVTAGSGTSAAGININSGTVTGDATGGTGIAAIGVNTNNGTIEGNVVATAANSSFGCDTNNGTIRGNVVGGTGPSAHGLQSNIGTVQGNVTGGSGSARGMMFNRGTIVGNIVGGTSVAALGVNLNSGVILGGTQNDVGAAIGGFLGSTLLINGPLCQISIPASVTKIYALFGAFTGSATIPIGTEVIVLSEGTSGIPIGRIISGGV